MSASRDSETMAAAMPTRSIPAALALIVWVTSGAAAQQVPAAPTDAAPVTVRGLAVRIDSLLDLPSVIERARAASPVIAQAEEGLRVARSEVSAAIRSIVAALSK